MRVVFLIVVVLAFSILYKEVEGRHRRRFFRCFWPRFRMRRFLVLLKRDLNRCTAGEETSTTADDITEIKNFIDARRDRCGNFPWFTRLEMRVNETAEELLNCLANAAYLGNCSEAVKLRSKVCSLWCVAETGTQSIHSGTSSQSKCANGPISKSRFQRDFDTECPSPSLACLHGSDGVCFPGDPAFCTDNNGNVCNSVNCGDDSCCVNFSPTA